MGCPLPPDQRQVRRYAGKIRSRVVRALPYRIFSQVSVLQARGLEPFRGGAGFGDARLLELNQ